MSIEMTTIVVGYLPTAEGAAALDHAKKWAVANSARLLMVNTGRNGDYSHPSFANAQELDAIEAEMAEARLGARDDPADRRSVCGRGDPQHRHGRLG